MRTSWPAFVRRVQNELSTSKRGFLNLDVPFAREQDLTRVIALGLRSLFIDFYGLASSPDVHHHVVYRQGDEHKDRGAWTAAKPDKWITVHGLNFVPDVLIRRTLNPVTDVLPIEIKLITKVACSQDVATAVGQAFAHSIKHPQSIAFVGVRRGLIDATHPLTNRAGHSRNEAILHRRLQGHGVSLLIREVDVAPRGSRTP
jgi:hypothetical protein